MPTATSIWSARPRPASCRPPPASFSLTGLRWTPHMESYVLADRGFVAKFTPVTSAGGASLAYCKYLGGQTANLNDYISGIAIDSASNAYVAGYTNSPDFPVRNGAYGTVCGPSGGTCAAAHVTKLNSVRHRHPVVHLCGRQQGEWKRRVILYGTH